MYNGWLEKWADTHEHTFFVNLWSPLMDAPGVVNPEIFLEDGLHMNAKGYGLWVEKLKPIIEMIEMDE